MLIIKANHGTVFIFNTNSLRFTYFETERHMDPAGKHPTLWTRSIYSFLSYCTDDKYAIII